MESRTIVTLKWGKLYSSDFVNRLYSAVSRHLAGDFRFVCFTDDRAGIDPRVDCFDIPPIDVPPPLNNGGWRKLCLFQKGLPISGQCLFMDLDIVVVGPLDQFFTYEPGKIPIIHNWTSRVKTMVGNRPRVGNSSLFRFPANECEFIVDQYHREKEWALKTFSPPQTYLTHCIRDRMVFWPEHWARSFKRHCQPPFPLNHLLTSRIPRDASVVVFHGRPNPDEVIAGFRDGKLRHTVLPTKWVSENWR